jgi:FkbM family methyltransferase
MESSVIQSLALRVYRTPFVRRFSQTQVGSAIFVFCYDVYKDVVEVPGNRALGRFIPPKSWVIDVGANIGFFTERFAKWVRDGGRVIAIEPDIQNVALLNKRLKRRRLTVVDVHQAAATDRSGTVYLSRNPSHPGDHRISDKGEKVSACTIDELVAQAGNPVVGLIKVDTQGSERVVLAGAAKTLERCRPTLFIEIDDAALRENDTTAAELVNELQTSQYRLFRVLRNGGQEEFSAETLIEALVTEKRDYLDLLCIHRSK